MKFRKKPVESEHACDWCPTDVRNLHAVAHNAAGAVRRALSGGGDWSRAQRKLGELERTLADIEPRLEKHFAESRR